MTSKLAKIEQIFDNSAKWAVVLVGLFLLALGLSLRLVHLERAHAFVVDPESYRKDPMLYRVLSSGHLPSAVDWAWIKSLSESDVYRSKDGQSHSPLFYDLDLVTELDALFAEVYAVGANLLAVLQNDGPGAKSLLEKGESFRKTGLQSLPELYRNDYWRSPWQIPLLLAYVHLFELANMPDAARYFKEAASLPGAPAYLSRLQRRFEQPGGEYEVGLKLLSFMISGATDPLIVEGLQKKQASLQIAQYLYDLNLKHRLAPHAPVPPQDPWGGHLSLDPSGKVVSTTPHDKVFGLD